MDIIMVRHGQTRDNLTGVYSRDETKLTKKGIEQIKSAKDSLEKFTYKKVYYSPLVRTRESLKHLGLEGTAEEKIREVSFGSFAGKTYKELESLYPKQVKLWQEDAYDFKFPQGGSLAESYRDIEEFLKMLIKEDEDVLLVTHGGIIRIVLSWVFDDLKWFYKFKVDNGSINIVSIEDDYKFIKKLNYDSGVRY